TLSGTFRFGHVTARVPSDRRRDTERNHTATHLLHAALRQVLGESVHQAGSLVAPERLRFDFTHHGPVNPERLDEIEGIVNREIWRATPVTTDEMAYQEARNAGAMALFGEKYGDVVRVVSIPGFSMELCGGTHVRNTAQIGFFKIVSETGVAAGVRRIEAVTGPGAYEFVRGEERQLHRVADALRVPTNQLERRVTQLLEERRTLERRLEDAMRGGGDQLQSLLEKAVKIGRNGARYVFGTVAAKLIWPRPACRTRTGSIAPHAADVSSSMPRSRLIHEHTVMAGFPHACPAGCFACAPPSRSRRSLGGRR